MSCRVCGDRGIVRVRYRDESPDMFGVCLCEAGQRWRDDRNAVGRSTGFPRWMVWAAQQQIAHESVAMVEALLDPEELAGIPREATVSAAATAIAAAMRTRRARL